MQTPPEKTIQARLILALKIAIVVGAMGYLIGSGKLRLSDLQVSASGIPVMAVAALALLGVLLLSFVRYQILLVGLGMKVPFREIIRIGFIGCFFNTFMLGGLGGDVIKLAYVMRATGRRAETVASVMIDRVLGLLGLISLGGLALYLSWDEVLATPALHGLCLAIFSVLGLASVCIIVSVVALAKGRGAGFAIWLFLLLTIGSFSWYQLQGDTLALFSPAAPEALLRGRAALILIVISIAAFVCMLMVPSCQPGRFLERWILAHMPLGTVIMRLIQSALVFKDRFRILVLAFALSVILQGFSLMALYGFSQALAQEPTPTLNHIFFAGPAAFIANVLPVPGGGLGVGETAMEEILSLCRDASGRPILSGSAIFLLFRFWQIILGFIGLPLYLRGKADIEKAASEYAATE